MGIFDIQTKKSQVEEMKPGQFKSISSNSLIGRLEWKNKCFQETLYFTLLRFKYTPA